MVVNGQPKGTAEYIQATSRVGRAFPGLVARVLTWARPRDLSHYETFEHYHATFYKHVEAQSVTPFSPRAMDRGLTGAMLSMMRHEYDPFAPNDGRRRARQSELGARCSTRSTSIVCTRLGGHRGLGEARTCRRRDEEPRRRMGQGGRRWAAGPSSTEKGAGAGPTARRAARRPRAIKPWSTWTVPMSMREVEPGVRLVMEDDRSTYDPDWRPRVGDPTTTTEDDS